jgi:hypothetical protein
MTKKNSKGQLLKIGDAASLLHVSTQTLRDWTDVGKIPTVLSDGGHRFYYEADVKKVQLEGKDITSYWESSIVLAFNTSGEITLLDEDGNSIQAPISYEKSLSRYWNFSNGLETMVHEVALNGVYQSSPTVTFLEQSTSPDHSLIVVYGTIAALEQDDIKRNYWKLRKETVEWAKKTFEPVSVPVWAWKNSGKLVPFQQ